MLERVSSSAECAAHLFLKRFEAPIQSHRVLGPAFWKHSGDRLSLPTWWPLYLESIRGKTAVGTHISEHTTKKRSSSTRGPQRHHANSSSSSNRLFTNSSSHLNTVVVSLPEVTSEEKSEIRHETWDQEQKEDKTTPYGEKAHSTQSIQHEPLFAHGEHPTPQAAWSQFVRQGQQTEHAQALLHILVQSEYQIDLDRAQSAFGLIPASRRTVSDYRAIVDASTKAKRYSFAINAIDEIISKNKGQDIFFTFLAHCVQNTLWNTAGDLWKTVGDPRSDILRRAAHTRTSKSPNFAGRFTTYFDDVDDFQSKVYRLAERLQKSDPILASRKRSLTALCKRLTYTIMESPKTMTFISAEALLSTFTIQSLLDFDSKLHFAALGTINRMADKGTKSQLARLVYSDYKSSFPGATIPKWVFGAMIGIGSAGNEHTSKFRALLEEYKVFHGTPDDQMYSQVLKACADQGAVVDVQEVFDEFCKNSEPKSADHINPLIRVYAVTGDAANAQAQFDSIKVQHDFEPDTKNWNTLLLAYARSNDPEQAFRVFEDMKMSKAKPDQYSWSIMVSVAAKRGDIDFAHKLMEQAASNKISPPLPMVGALVDSYLLSDRLAEAETMIINATKASLKDSPVRLWNSLFCYYAFRADSAAIVRTQQTMRRFDVKPDGMTYATLMTALVVQGRTQDAAQILRTLYFSRSLNATEFHYSILIHGFAMEKRHDLANLVYQEMTQRFSRTTPSAALAMLNLSAVQAEAYAERSTPTSKIVPKPYFGPTLDLMVDILDSMEASDIASNTPNPGFGRKSARSDLDLVFFTSLARSLQRNRAYRAAQQLMRDLPRATNSATKRITKAAPSWLSSLEALSLQLKASVERSDLQTTDKTWNLILTMTLQHCSRFVEKKPQPDSKTQVTTLSDKDSTEADMETPFVDMIAHNDSQQGSNMSNITILPAHRFFLSRQISTYIHALDKRSLHDSILTEIQKLQEHGFKLSSKNWNSLIQALCRSTDPKHHVLAFEYFDQHMLINTPSWKLICRGKWILPSKERRSSKAGAQRDGIRKQATLAKTHPDLITPTYFTMVHLAMVVLRISQPTNLNGRAVRLQLLRDFPRTFRFVRSIPYLKDRIQGVLLRNRRVIGDPVKRSRRFRTTGSLTRQRNVPLALLKDAEQEISPYDDIRSLLAGKQAMVVRSATPHDVSDKTETLLHKSRSSSLVTEKTDGESQNMPEQTRENERRRLGILQHVSGDVQDPTIFAGTIMRHSQILVSSKEGSKLPTRLDAEQDQTRTRDEPSTPNNNFVTRKGKKLRKLHRTLMRVSKKTTYSGSALNAGLRRYPINMSEITARKRPTPARIIKIQKLLAAQKMEITRLNEMEASPEVVWKPITSQH